MSLARILRDMPSMTMWWMSMNRDSPPPDLTMRNLQAPFPRSKGLTRPHGSKPSAISTVSKSMPSAGSRKLPSPSEDTFMVSIGCAETAALMADSSLAASVPGGSSSNSGML
jgi:hypothetical protein